MCRIFGISYGGDEEVLSTGDIARIMGIALTDGGKHAFGWAQKAGDNVAVRKFPGRFDENVEKTFSIRRTCDWFIGHTRWATHGDSSNLNNVHPILHDNILGVHNGVLNNHEAILKRCGGRMNDATQVDSEAIFAAVEHLGAEKGLAALYGSMVAVFTDLRDPHPIYVARSNSRALRLGWTAAGNLIFASEQRALDLLEEAGIEFVKFSGISENRLLKIENGEITDRLTYRAPVKRPTFSMPVITTVEGDYNAMVAQRRGAKMMPQKRNEQAISAFDEARQQTRDNSNGWHRSHHNENTKPHKPKKGKKGQRSSSEIGVIVGPNRMLYKGQEMSTEEYITLRSKELTEAVIAPEESWGD